MDFRWPPWGHYIDVRSTQYEEVREAYETADNWIERDCDPDIEILRMNQPAEVTRNDECSICRQNTFFSSNQDMGMERYNDPENTRSNNRVRSKFSG